MAFRLEMTDQLFGVLTNAWFTLHDGDLQRVASEGNEKIRCSINVVRFTQHIWNDNLETAEIIAFVLCVFKTMREAMESLDTATGDVERSYCYQWQSFVHYEPKANSSTLDKIHVLSQSVDVATKCREFHEAQALLTDLLPLLIHDQDFCSVAACVHDVPCLSRTCVREFFTYPRLVDGKGGQHDY